MRVPLLLAGLIIGQSICSPALAQMDSNPLLLATYQVAMIDSTKAPKECQHFQGAWGDGHWLPSKNHLEIWITQVADDCTFNGRLFWAPEKERSFVRTGDTLKGSIDPKTMTATFPVGRRGVTMAMEDGRRSKLRSYPEGQPNTNDEKQIANATLTKLVVPEPKMFGDAPRPFNLNISKEPDSGCADIRGVWQGGWREQPAVTYVEHIQKISGVCHVTFVYAVGAARDRTDIVPMWLRVSGVLEGETLRATPKIFGGVVQYGFKGEQAKLWWNNAEANLSRTSRQ